MFTSICVSSAPDGLCSVVMVTHAVLQIILMSGIVLNQSLKQIHTAVKKSFMHTEKKCSTIILTLKSQQAATLDCQSDHR